MDPADPAHDLDILSASYKLIADVGAFDDMLAAWDRRLSADVPPDEESRSMARLSGYLGDIMHLIDTVVVKAPENTPASGNRPAFVVSSTGRVLSATRSACEQFALVPDTETDFNWINPASQNDFNAILRGCEDKERPQHAIMRLTDEAGSTYLAEVFHIATPDKPKLTLGVRVLDLVWNTEVADILQRKFALTESEVDIARLLLETCDTSEMAARRETSIRTIRTQLTSIFQKTGTQTQVDLVRLLAVLCARVDTAADSAISPWVDPFGKETQLTLQTGKSLAWSQTGDPGGVPVILLHGPGMSYALPKSAQTCLANGGVRLIALSRPGYGNSSRDVEGGQARSIIRAVRALMADLNLASAHFVGVNNASVPIMEFAVEAPERVNSLTIACGLLPRETRAAAATIPLAQRTLFNLRRVSKSATELVARAGLKAIRTHGYDWYLARAYAESPTDQKSLNNPIIRALAQSGCEMMIAQSYHAFVDDLDLALHPWARLISQIRQPVHILHGADDRLCPTAQLRELWAPCPTCTITEIPDAAELLYHQAADRVAAHLCALIKT